MLRFCTSSFSGFFVGSQHRYANSLHINMTLFVNACDFKSKNYSNDCQNENKQKNFFFVFGMACI